MTASVRWDSPTAHDENDEAPAGCLGRQLQAALAELLGEPVDVVVVDALSDCTGRQVASVMFRVRPPNHDCVRAAAATCTVLNARVGHGRVFVLDDHADVVWAFVDDLAAYLSDADHG